MLREFADAQQSAVPLVRNTRVNADKEGEIVVDGRRTVGTGYKGYAAAVVRTIRAERRGLDRARQTVKSLLTEEGGRVEDILDSREEASSGIGVSASEVEFDRVLLLFE